MLWFPKKTKAMTTDGVVALHPNGAVAWGTPTRRCPKCDWLGDWIVIPLPPSKVAPANTTYYDDDDDDNLEDYINHYYH
ncbi:MAG: hypothetical protein RLZ28_131 [Actinomycetota bacterium]|jgi:hypothetical protein